MSLMEIVDKLSEEAILLEPGKVASCGRMLSLLDTIDHPAIDNEKNRLKTYLETMILHDLEGGEVNVDDIVQSVESVQNIIRSVMIKESGEEQDTVSEEVGETDDGREDTDAVPADEIPFDEADTETDTEENEDTTEIIDMEIESDDFEEVVTVDAAVAVSADATAAPTPEKEEEEEPEMVEDLDLVSDFIAEAREHLDSIELNMVEWERSPGDKEIINSIFRPFHTIKGVAGFLNLKKINHLSHQLENLLDEARDGKLKLTPDLSDLIFDGVDVLKSMIQSLEAALGAGGPVEYTIDTKPIMRNIAAILSGAPIIEDVDASPAPTEPLGEILVRKGKINEDDLRTILEKQSASESRRPVGELLIEEKKVSARDVRDAIRSQGEASKARVEKHIKVDTHKMDQLLNMVGELVIAQSMVTHNPDVLTITNQRFIRDISQLTRVTSTLQNISMSMRLVPIGQTFQKMNRIVRDLAHKSGKKINLVLQGESAEIDRNMVEELYDPLVHMIRNSCDHGIQAPEKRTSKGKPAEGTITLKAEHSGGKIVITISDDGEGLDRETILAKAREKGLWTEEERPDNKTIDNYIFAAGFSTAKQVTDVSGRGVGMDVVRKSLEKLHGTVDIASTPGEGTTFTIKLPLTTAIIDGMLVQVGEERFIIPTLSVRQLVHPKKEDVTSVIGRGEVVTVRGKLLPLFKLSEVLSVEGRYRDAWEGVLVIVEDIGREIALHVDAVIGKQEVVIKSLDERFVSRNSVSGSAILGDGRVGLILDIRSIVGNN